MKKLLIISALILTAASTALSQNSADALRYSRLDIGGTARYMGLSGAFGALGADFTVSSTNPAGLGMYKSSELMVTPAVHIGSVESDLNGMINSDSRTNFYIGSAGFVMSSQTNTKPNKKGWKYVTFATGLNRLADFNNRYQMRGNNDHNSMLDVYVNDAKGVNFHDIEDDPNGNYAFDLNLAWWDWLIDLVPGSDSSTYYSPIPQNIDKIQNKYIDSWGSMNEYVFSFAGNYNDRLYLGMTLGLPYLRYYESSLYTEQVANPEASDLEYFDRYEDLETRGAGFNFKLGAIYRANDWLRVGAAFHSPSWYGNMRDYWQATMISQFYTPDNNGETMYVKTSPSGYYEYNMTTPWRLQGNLAFIIGNIGLVSADYEFVNYSQAKFDSYQFDEYLNSQNLAIENSYKGAHNIRVGTEWRYNIFSFRAGAKYATSPYQNDINDGSSLGFSGGIGFRQKWFFMDIAYAYNNMKSDYYFYNSGGISADPVANSTRSHCILMTVGAKM
jgi:hypothetical protein